MYPRQESIFSSTIRSFFVALFAVLGVAVAGVIIVLILMSVSGSKTMTGTYNYSLLPDDEGNRKEIVGASPVVLWINIEGVIGKPGLMASDVFGQLVESREGFLAGNRVKAVMLRINTPGGLATDAFDMYNTLLEYKQRYQVPVYAFVDGLCASGGMMVACAADKIYSTEFSVIGSVGVIAQFFNISQLMDKVGVQQLTMTEGKGKDDLNPFRPWQPGEGQDEKEIMDSIYAQFVNLVVKARPKLSQNELLNTLGAKVFIASKAETLGYIDAVIPTYTQALKDLVTAAGISDGNYQVVELYPSTWLSGLLGPQTQKQQATIKHEIQMPEAQGILQRQLLYQP